ncbi:MULTISPECIES: DUF3073 domain-containing protein [Cellulomonas]|uniref:DUF3073 domain-containing protein n=1 Tax=Cellulomonas gilvus (strain ATCC 13127 / NRRL B-14078) TaxID=593907 RepID=F8A4G6_CELGA|nr:MULTISPECIES: DUF3073 domain-containing protein [Cellulomonas]AEI13214.1 hypothetical protein Celgi_2715 [Cellulomonas gilvus ATCC 13127]MCR6689028.1 DUF3073 domain-containing protein [Cellulomonas sp.]
MGRGRQKAKQTKVARELKYFSPDTNYRALEQELASRSPEHVDRRGGAAVDTDDGDEDEYPGWINDER